MRCSNACVQRVQQAARAHLGVGTIQCVEPFAQRRVVRDQVPHAAGLGLRQFVQPVPLEDDVWNLLLSTHRSTSIRRLRSRLRTPETDIPVSAATCSRVSPST